MGRVTKTWSDITSLNFWVVRDYYRLVELVNGFEPKIRSLSDVQVGGVWFLCVKIESFRVGLICLVLVL